MSISQRTKDLLLGVLGGQPDCLKEVVDGLNGGDNAISSINSLNPVNGNLNILAGSGINVSSVGNSITITNMDAGGSVTSVGMTVPSFLSVSGSPITTSGTLAVSLVSQSQNLIFASPNNSSGNPSFRALAVADVPILNQNTTGTAANITASSNSTLITLSSLSLPTSQLSGNIGLTTQVTGVLPIANGGTNNGSLAVTAGGVLYTDGSKLVNVGAGTSGQILQSNGASAPTWVPASGGSSPIGQNVSSLFVSAAQHDMGSTNTSTVNYTGTPVINGTDISCSQSTSLGTFFTINTSGIYSITCNIIDDDSANNPFAFTLNAQGSGDPNGSGSSILATSVGGLSDGQVQQFILAFSINVSYAGNSQSGMTCPTLYYNAGDRIRVQSNIGALLNTTTYNFVKISRLF